MKFDALIVIDILTALINEHPYNEVVFIEKVKALITYFRDNKIPSYMCNTMEKLEMS